VAAWPVVYTTKLMWVRAAPPAYTGSPHEPVVGVRDCIQDYVGSRRELARRVDGVAGGLTTTIPRKFDRSASRLVESIVI
jgi:hypothetical protein